MSLPLLNEGELDLVVSYSLDSGEEISEAIVQAFLAANIDVFHNPTQLADWVNPDVFNDVEWSSDSPVYFCTRIWDYKVVITAEEIHIYNLPVLV